jgi:hypothetical protein
MQVEIVVETDGNRLPKLNYSDLQASLQSEVDKFSKLVEGRSEAKGSGRPDGAQGDDLIIQWLIEFAQQPAMFKVYARSLIFGISEVLRAAKERAGGQQDENAEGPSARLKLLGKEISVPTTAAAIKAFFEDGDVDA